MRIEYWNGLEATGYPFEMKVAEELQAAKWDFLCDYPVSVLPDAANLQVEETAIDFKAWQETLFVLIEARRAAFCKWIFFRKNTKDFFVLSHHEDSKKRSGFQFPLRRDINPEVRWIHCQSITRFSAKQEVYSNAISVNSRKDCRDGNEDQRINNSEIRKGAKQASIATIGIINDDYSFMKKAISSIRPPPDLGSLYFPIIVTAAQLSVLDFSSKQIDKNGLLPDIDKINSCEVPWVIYRFSLPRTLWLPVYFPENTINDHTLLDRHRKLDIFVVNIQYLQRLLKELQEIVR